MVLCALGAGVLTRALRLDTAGVRAAFVASQHAARRMVPAQRGLIVHVSSWAAQKYGGNVVYGMANAATDRMAADMAHQLRAHGVTVVSLDPGLVRTEAVLAAGVFDLSSSESPEFIGRAVAALAGDRDVLRRSGSVLVAAALAEEYRTISRYQRCTADSRGRPTRYCPRWSCIARGTSSCSRGGGPPVGPTGRSRRRRHHWSGSAASM
jgi:NAD(P)-dependent dehydrogenase (short-subunit alcohol dehydrogenase family)